MSIFPEKPPSGIDTSEDIRHLLTTYAYNILGSYEDARDIVQDVYLKFSDRDAGEIENKRAYMIRMVINMSINLKNRQKKLVDDYPGEWLPEPVETERADTALMRKEVLSYSLMILLEKLTARQRAVYILKEAFDYDHKEIAAVLDISEENSRKIFSRAKSVLKKPAQANATVIPEGYLDKYLEVIHNADTQQLENLLQNDIVLVSDGGGKAAATLYPISGRQRVVKFLIGISGKFYDSNEISIKKSNINHLPALLYYHKGALINCQVFAFEDRQISRIYFIRNPDKLRLL